MQRKLARGKMSPCSVTKLQEISWHFAASTLVVHPVETGNTRTELLAPELDSTSQ